MILEIRVLALVWLLLTLFKAYSLFMKPADNLSRHKNLAPIQILARLDHLELLTNVSYETSI